MQNGRLTNIKSGTSSRAFHIVDGKPLEIEYEYNQSITFKPDPRKDGFNFMGWSVEGGAPVPLTMPAYDLDIYGTFSPQTFSIIYFVGDNHYWTQGVRFAARQ